MNAARMTLLHRWKQDGRWRRKAAFVIFASVQAFAAAFFLADVSEELGVESVTLHSTLEALITLGLLFGAIFGISELRRSHDQLQSHEKTLAVASGALATVIEDHFAGWGFTPSEREVAMLSLKGFDLADIARLRGTASGTVRAQLAAVYAKSGTSGRAQFTSLFVEDLLAGGVDAAVAARPGADAAT